MISPTSIDTIEIHAFRWARGREKNVEFDNGVLERLRLGHLGIRVNGENIVNSKNIYSFRPTKPVGMPMDEFIARIRKGESFVGQVPSDGDNMLFEIAMEICGEPDPCNRRIYYLDEKTCLEIKKQLDDDIENSKKSLLDKRYSLPPKEEGVRWEEHCFNCITYLNSVGFKETPYPSGRLGDYLEKGVYEITIYRCS
jgi:hypothetical protein